MDLSGCAGLVAGALVICVLAALFTATGIAEPTPDLPDFDLVPTRAGLSTTIDSTIDGMTDAAISDELTAESLSCIIPLALSALGMMWVFMRPANADDDD